MISQLSLATDFVSEWNGQEAESEAYVEATMTISLNVWHIQMVWPLKQKIITVYYINGGTESRHVDVYISPLRIKGHTQYWWCEMA